MRRLVLLCIACAASCGGEPVPDADLALRIRTPQDAVAQGAGFPLTVERVWRKSLVPTPWNDRALSPLDLRLVEAERRENETHVQEVHHYRAYAFEPGTTEIRGLSVRAVPRGGGPEQIAEAGDLTLQVTPVLDSTKPGDVEWPGEPVPPSSPWIPWAAAAVALGAAALFGNRRRRKRAPPADPPRSETETLGPPQPDVLALERLAALRHREARTDEAAQAWSFEATAALRDYATARFDVRARELTTEELCEVLPSQGLSDILAPCDRIKFARHLPTAAEQTDVLNRAEAWVKETAR